MPWTWVRATCRGTSHIASGTPCQDYSCCVLLGRQNKVLVGVISDGAGSGSHSRHGAALVCRTAIAGARAHYRSSDTPPADEVIWSWLDDARDRIRLAASRRAIDSRQFAATFVCVLASGAETVVLHVGDGAAVVKIGDEWSVASWPDTGEYASTTFFVTDEPSPKLRITRIAGAVRALAIFSDGMERLTLSFAEQRAHPPFFEAMIRPVLSGSAGQNLALSSSLATYLDGAAVNARTDDDKSMILAARV